MCGSPLRLHERGLAGSCLRTRGNHKANSGEGVIATVMMMAMA
jgi:hypothetical protein